MDLNLDDTVVTTELVVSLTGPAARAVADIDPAALGKLMANAGPLCVDAIGNAALSLGINLGAIEGAAVEVTTSATYGATVAGTA